jgi:glucan phosphoethanolaminetransferase (alkaline phosphatase superfamily)
MNSKLSKILTIIAGVIGLIGFYFFIRIVMEGDDVIKTDVALQNSILSPFINYSVVLLGIVTLISVVFSLINLFKNPEILKRTLIGVAFLAVLLVIAYSVSSDAAVTDAMGKIIKDGEAGSVSKWVGTLIYYSYYLGFIGLAMFLFDFMKSLVK